ncbi:MAG: SMP-30/gluconolactonase/LRE family protein [Hyphomonadaceae bacterium]
MTVEIVAEGLGFPEGPIAMEDGSIVLVEIRRGTLTRCWNGKTEVVADLGGGPNGAAIGPDGAIYVCNNGGFKWHERNGLVIAGHAPADYAGGWIERVDPATGEADRLYTHCGDIQLRGPNDIVFDRHGGFYFTDHGKSFPRSRDVGGLFYARPDGSSIVEVTPNIISANGVGLSPDEDVVYVADSLTGRLWAMDLEAPGKAKRGPMGAPGRLAGDLPGVQYCDSLAVTASGRVCVATLPTGAISSIDPADGAIEQVMTGDPWTTNICFGGADMREAWITLSGTGKLGYTRWAEPGLRLNFNA